MADAWDDDAQARIQAVIAGSLGESAPFVRGWVLCVSYIDDDGELTYAFNCAEEARRSETLGLLSYAIEVEKAALIAEELKDRGVL